MKTIHVTDKMYDALMEISKGLNTQDNRATAKPYFYQIQCKKEVVAVEGSGDVVYVDENGKGELRDDDDIKEVLVEYYYDNWEEELDDEIDEVVFSDLEGKPSDSSHPYVIKAAKEKADQVMLSGYDISAELEKMGYKERWVTTDYEYKNAFFTEKACKKHIEQNHYHYNNPVDYISHGFRNPELETVWNFLYGLKSGVNKKE